VNAVIYATAHAASRLGWKVFGIREGHDGLLCSHQHPDRGLVEPDVENVKNIPHLEGTMLGTINRANPFLVAEHAPHGTVKQGDRSDVVIEGFRKHDIDAHIAVGGARSLTIALRLHQKGGD